MNKIRPQHIILEQDHPNVLHCPICGQSMLKLDESGPEDVVDITPCKHLQFVWFEECFGHVSEQFEARCREADGQVQALAEQHDWQDELPDINDDELDLGDYINTVLFEEDEFTFMDYLALIGYNRELVCFELVEHGMACGPGQFSSFFGFDCSLEAQ